MLWHPIVETPPKETVPMSPSKLVLNGNSANPFGMVFLDIKGTLRR